MESLMMPLENIIYFDASIAIMSIIKMLKQCFLSIVFIHKKIKISETSLNIIKKIVCF